MHYRIVSRDPLHKGFFKLERFVFEHELFAGGTAQMEREILVRAQAAALLPYDPVRDEVVLIEQFRAGPAAVLDRAWMIEAVAGIIDTHETPDRVARREALEEAGLEVGRVLEAPVFYPSPGGCDEKVFCYIGEVDASAAGGMFGLEHEGEDIRAFVLPFAEAIEWLEAGRLDNSATLVLMMWLERKRTQLRRDWAGVV
ncbi:NUDIX domain-containing protein [Radicibacter daui]|uniref:NUDIX domain-containing protein n=1 Tax=Radicibacter daui TaxID=3064829 RepID=UPI004046B25F